MVKSKDYEELNLVLHAGHSEGYSLDLDTFSWLIEELSRAKQHALVVFTFQTFQLRDEEISPESVIEAVGSAYAIRNHELCEQIFASFLGKVDFPIKTINTVLKNFYAQTNPLVAREFLMQIWDKADEETLAIAFRKVADISQDSREIVDLMYKFKDGKGRISEHLYATILECLLDLGDAELMIDITRTIEADGLFGTARVQEVILQQLLCEKNEGRIEAYLSLFEQQNRINVTARPFERAAVHFSRIPDTDGILTIVNWMSRCNLDITGPVMNAFLSCVLRNGNPSKLVDNLEGWTQLGVVGTNATVHLLWNGLLKKYPDHGIQITRSMQEMGKECPNLYKGLSADTFSTVEIVEKNWDDNGKIIVKPSSKDKNSTLYALRRVQELNQHETPQLGIEVIEDLIRRNVKPTPQIFNTVLHGLCKAGLSTDFDVALRMMEEAGYKPEPMLKLIFLRTHLHRMRDNSPSSLPTYTQKLLAVQRIKQFVYEHRNQLNLKMATSIGFELLFFEEIDYAISMFNYFRKDGEPITSSNHDSESLCGLVKAFAIKGHFHEVIKVVNYILMDSGITLDHITADHSTSNGNGGSSSNQGDYNNDTDNYNSGSGIVLRSSFEWQLNDCVVRARQLNNDVIVEAMEQQLKLVRIYRELWTARDVDHSLEMVLRIFRGWEGLLERKHDT